MKFFIFNPLNKNRTKVEKYEGIRQKSFISTLPHDHLARCNRGKTVGGGQTLKNDVFHIEHDLDCSCCE
jgi:hypothetical protein